MLRMTVAELRDKMDNVEFHLWNLFLRLEEAEQNRKEV